MQVEWLIHSEIPSEPTRGLFSELVSGVGDTNNFKVNRFSIDLLFLVLLISDFLCFCVFVQLVVLLIPFFQLFCDQVSHKVSTERFSVTKTLLSVLDHELL